MNKQKPHRLIWVDLEMTGLDPEEHVIIEIATVVTDTQLDEVAVGPVLALEQSEQELKKMNQWNQQQHSQSGLIERVRASYISTEDAEQQTLAFLRQHVGDQCSPMCGNSICTDRRFLARHMPALEAYFHYRNLDVSSLKIVADLWVPELLDTFDKQSEHLALADIRQSIAELRYYRRCLLANAVSDK